MDNLFGGVKFNLYDIDKISDLVNRGYKYYVSEDIQDNGIDPWSGMPNSHKDHYAFKDEDNAKEFANIAVGNIFNKYIKAEVKSLENLLNRKK